MEPRICKEFPGNAGAGSAAAASHAGNAAAATARSTTATADARDATASAAGPSAASRTAGNGCHRHRRGRHCRLDRPGCCLPRRSARPRRQAHHRREPAPAPCSTTDSWLSWWWWSARLYRPRRNRPPTRASPRRRTGSSLSVRQTSCAVPNLVSCTRGTRDERVRNALNASGIRLVWTTERGSAERSSPPCTRARRR